MKRLKDILFKRCFLCGEPRGAKRVNSSDIDPEYAGPAYYYYKRCLEAVLQNPGMYWETAEGDAINIIKSLQSHLSRQARKEKRRKKQLDFFMKNKDKF